MKTTLDLPEELLEEARRLSGLRTKRAVVLAALEEFIRRRRKEQLLDMLGRTEVGITHAEVEELRGDDEAADAGELRIVSPGDGEVEG